MNAKGKIALALAACSLLSPAVSAALGLAGVISFGLACTGGLAAGFVFAMLFCELVG